VIPDNPYQSPNSALDAESVRTTLITNAPASGPIVPRYIAALVDEVVAFLLGILAAKSLPNSLPILQFIAAVAVVLGYFFLSEWFFSRTPGKFMAGLKVLRKNGEPITARQSLIRTLFRIIEVNPFLLGALPAAICIIFSKKRQRLGDMIAGTVVVPVSPRTSR
jgi:uncharacterized RDD family membrane protein YckC